MIITDMRLLENLKVISESKTSGTMKIRGTFQRADEANNNNRVYSKSILEGQIKKLDEKIKNRSLMGELDHPADSVINLNKVSHVITNLYMEGNEVIGEAELLNTPGGQIAQALISAGVKVGISSRGIGTLSEDKSGIKKVNSDYELITFDLVADPSTKGAFPGICESTDKTQKLIKDTYKKALGEKIFLTLLEEKLESKFSKNKKEKFFDTKRITKKSNKK